MSKTDNRIYVPEHEQRLIHRALLFLADNLEREAGKNNYADTINQHLVFGCRYTRDMLRETACRFGALPVKK